MSTETTESLGINSESGSDWTETTPRDARGRRGSDGSFSRDYYRNFDDEHDRRRPSPEHASAQRRTRLHSRSEATWDAHAQPVINIRRTVPRGVPQGPQAPTAADNPQPPYPGYEFSYPGTSRRRSHSRPRLRPRTRPEAHTSPPPPFPGMGQQPQVPGYAPYQHVPAPTQYPPSMPHYTPAAPQVLYPNRYPHYPMLPANYYHPPHFYSPPTVQTARRPSPAPSSQCSETAVDLEKVRLEAELAALKAEESKQKAKESAKELFEQTRRDAEKDMEERFEALVKARHEEQQRLEAVKLEAENAAWERFLAERRAQAERDRISEAQTRRIEKEMRAKIEEEKRVEEAARNAKAKQDKDYERLVRETLVKSMEKLFPITTERLLFDLGVDRGEVDEFLPREQNLGNQDTSSATVDDDSEPFSETTDEREPIRRMARQTRRGASRSRAVSSQGARSDDTDSSRLYPPRAWPRPRRRRSRVSTRSSSTETSASYIRVRSNLDGSPAPLNVPSGPGTSDDEATWVPPTAPDAPRTGDYESRTSSDEAEHQQNSARMDRGYDSASEDNERYFYDDAPLYPVDELADHIVEGLLCRLSGPLYGDRPRPRPESPSRRGSIYSYTSGSDMARGGGGGVRTGFAQSVPGQQSQFRSTGEREAQPSREEPRGREPRSASPAPSSSSEKASASQSQAPTVFATPAESRAGDESDESATRVDSQASIADMAKKQAHAASALSRGTSRCTSLWRRRTQLCDSCGRLAAWCTCFRIRVDPRFNAASGGHDKDG